MAQTYLLIPGLLLPKSATAALSDTTLQLLGKLTAGCAAPLEQALCAPEQSASPHLVWTWRVLTRSSKPFATAPYRWLIDNGPRLGGEIWRLTFFSTSPTGQVKCRSTLNEAQIETLCLALRVPLAEAGFTLQRWDKMLYLTRKHPWGVIVREAETLYGQTLSDKTYLACVDKTEGELAAQKAQTTLAKLNAVLATLRIASADALWIDGGGYAEDFYPPTKIRSVLADDPAILGWAQACGILNHRTGRATGASCWPNDAPNGECIAILETLYKAWLMRDWALWQAGLPGLTEQVQTLRVSARKRCCDALLLVACGQTRTKSFQAKLMDPRSILSRLAGPKPLDPRTWIFEE